MKVDENATHMGYRNRPDMHELGDGFIERMQAGATKPEPKVVSTLMMALMEDSLNHYLVAPANTLNVRPNIKRSVEFAAGAVTKAGGVVIKQATKKMSLAQNRSAADYMENMRLLFDEDGVRVSYAAFPMGDEMRALAVDVLPKAMAKELSDSKEFAKFLSVMLETALNWYVREPVKLMKFGPILSKVVSVGVDAITAALNAAIRDIVPKLNADEMAEFAEYLAGSMIEWHEPQ